MHDPLPPRRRGDLDFRNRDDLFAKAERERFDVIVVGGGITGAGVARSAAARGLSVALIEARDLASGTSSRSSKLIHGGIRYLAQGAFWLVRETARERQVLRTVAPHLVRLSPMLIPTRSTAGAAKFRAGVGLFERLGQVPQRDRHDVWNAAQLREREPVAAVDGVQGAVHYHEFSTDDARLTLANARSAAGDGALVLTYAPVVEILKQRGKAFAVRCRSSLSGESLEATIHGRMIVNAAGPWVDALRSLESSSARPQLTLTKGIHLVVPHAQLPLAHTVVFEAADKRPVFAVPRRDVCYLGTTDTFHPEAEYWPDVREEEVGYLLSAAARAFTTPLLATDLISSWTGLRPLISQPGRRPAEISRRDEVWIGPAGVLSIAGGKLTAYRAMAERVVDRVCRLLGKPTISGDTDQTPLIGGDCNPAALIASRRVGSASWSRLVELYGDEATAIDEDGGDVAAEVRQAVRREGALRLEDYWVRRSARALYDADSGMSALEPASREMAKLLGWTDKKRLDELAVCRRRHASNLVPFDRPPAEVRRTKGSNHGEVQSRRAS